MAYPQWRSGFFVDSDGNVHGRIRNQDKWGIHWEGIAPQHISVPISVAADLFHITPMAVHHWMAAGTIRAQVRFGQHVIPMSELVRIAIDRGLVDEE